MAGGAGWGADPVGAQREPRWDFGECGVCARHSGGLLPAAGFVSGLCGGRPGALLWMVLCGCPTPLNP